MHAAVATINNSNNTGSGNGTGNESSSLSDAAAAALCPPLPPLPRAPPASLLAALAALPPQLLGPLTAVPARASPVGSVALPLGAPLSVPAAAAAALSAVVEGARDAANALFWRSRAGAAVLTAVTAARAVIADRVASAVRSAYSAESTALLATAVTRAFGNIAAVLPLGAVARALTSAAYPLTFALPRDAAWARASSPFSLTLAKAAESQADTASASASVGADRAVAIASAAVAAVSSRVAANAVAFVPAATVIAARFLADTAAARQTARVRAMLAAAAVPAPAPTTAAAAGADALRLLARHATAAVTAVVIASNNGGSDSAMSAAPAFVPPSVAARILRRTASASASAAATVSASSTVGAAVAGSALVRLLSPPAARAPAPAAAAVSAQSALALLASASDALLTALLHWTEFTDLSPATAAALAAGLTIIPGTAAARARGGAPPLPPAVRLAAEAAAEAVARGDPVLATVLASGDGGREGGGALQRLTDTARFAESGALAAIPGRDNPVPDSFPETAAAAGEPVGLELLGDAVAALFSPSVRATATTHARAVFREDTLRVLGHLPGDGSWALAAATKGPLASASKTTQQHDERIHSRVATTAFNTAAAEVISEYRIFPFALRATGVTSITNSNSDSGSNAAVGAGVALRAALLTAAAHRALLSGLQLPAAATAAAAAAAAFAAGTPGWLSAHSQPRDLLLGAGVNAWTAKLLALAPAAETAAAALAAAGARVAPAAAPALVLGLALSAATADGCAGSSVAALDALGAALSASASASGLSVSAASLVNTAAAAALAMSGDLAAADAAAARAATTTASAIHALATAAAAAAAPTATDSGAAAGSDTPASAADAAARVHAASPAAAVAAREALRRNAAVDSAHALGGGLTSVAGALVAPGIIPVHSSANVDAGGNAEALVAGQWARVYGQLHAAALAASAFALCPAPQGFASSATLVPAPAAPVAATVRARARPGAVAVGSKAAAFVQPVAVSMPRSSALARVLSAAAGAAGDSLFLSSSNDTNANGAADLIPEHAANGVEKEQLQLLHSLHLWSPWEGLPCRSYGGARALLSAATSLSAAATATAAADVAAAAAIAAGPAGALDAAAAVSARAGELLREAARLQSSKGLAHAEALLDYAAALLPAAMTAANAEADASTAAVGDSASGSVGVGASASVFMPPAAPAYAKAAASSDSLLSLVTASPRALPAAELVRALTGDVAEATVAALTLAPQLHRTAHAVGVAQGILATVVSLSLFDPLFSQPAAATDSNVDSSGDDFTVAPDPPALSLSQHGLQSLTAPLITAAAALSERLAHAGVALHITAADNSVSGHLDLAVSDAWERSVVLHGEGAGIDLSTPLTSHALGPYTAAHALDALMTRVMFTTRDEWAGSSNANSAKTNANSASASTSTPPVGAAAAAAAAKAAAAKAAASAQTNKKQQRPGARHRPGSNNNNADAHAGHGHGRRAPSAAVLVSDDAPYTSGFGGLTYWLPPLFPPAVAAAQYTLASVLVPAPPRALSLPGPLHLNPHRLLARLYHFAAVKGGWQGAAADAAAATATAVAPVPAGALQRLLPVAAAAASTNAKSKAERGRVSIVTAPARALAVALAAAATTAATDAPTNANMLQSASSALAQLLPALSAALSQYRSRLAAARNARAREATAAALRAASGLRAPRTALGSGVLTAGDWAAYLDGSAGHGAAADAVAVVTGAGHWAETLGFSVAVSGKNDKTKGLVFLEPNRNYHPSANGTVDDSRDGNEHHANSMLFSVAAAPGLAAAAVRVATELGGLTSEEAETVGSSTLHSRFVAGGVLDLAELAPGLNKAIRQTKTRSDAQVPQDGEIDEWNMSKDDIVADLFTQMPTDVLSLAKGLLAAAPTAPYAVTVARAQQFIMGTLLGKIAPLVAAANAPLAPVLASYRAKVAANNTETADISSLSQQSESAQPTVATTFTSAAVAALAAQSVKKSSSSHQTVLASTLAVNAAAAGPDTAAVTAAATEAASAFVAARAAALGAATAAAAVLGGPQHPTAVAWWRLANSIQAEAALFARAVREWKPVA